MGTRQLVGGSWAAMLEEDHESGFVHTHPLAGRKQTPGLYKVSTHSHSSLRRLFAKKSVNKQVNIPTAQKEPGFSVVSLSYCYRIDFTIERDSKLHICVTLFNWKNA